MFGGACCIFPGMYLCITIIRADFFLYTENKLDEGNLILL